MRGAEELKPPGLEAHCSGFCYFFLHKTSPWSFHSVTIDERSFITTFLLSISAAKKYCMMSHKAKVAAKTPERLSTLCMTSIYVFCVIYVVLVVKGGQSCSLLMGFVGFDFNMAEQSNSFEGYESLSSSFCANNRTLNWIVLLSWTQWIFWDFFWRHKNESWFHHFCHVERERFEQKQGTTLMTKNEGELQSLSDDKSGWTFL